jgi:glucose/arabinose dehydrogenase
VESQSAEWLQNCVRAVRQRQARWQSDRDAWCRPVGVAIDCSGALLVADDVGNIVWRVTPKQQTSSR